VKPAASMRVGIDLVQVSRMAESVERFGDRFLRRVFTAGEIAYATSAPAVALERLAARFAAKEATMKALGLVEDPCDWRHIEVRRSASGSCDLALHGHVREAAARLGAEAFALSMSHEGDYATAVVVTTIHTSQD
jgi:holo-[acyl-carrier protein] synthase